jgi:FKBP-type peptidyl-prolyl cis-trans isomerase
MKLSQSLLALFPALALVVLLPACGSSPDDATVTTEDLIVGTGATAVNGDFLTVTYVGTFTSGTQFDAGTNYTFRLGAGNVIKGWDRGVPGMKIGGKRRLTVPPELAYGKDGNTTIPGNSTLKFDITLQAIAGK